MNIDQHVSNRPSFYEFLHPLDVSELASTHRLRELFII